MTSFGRVISVRGSLARVGVLAQNQMPVSEVRGTVGRFVSIRCATSTIIAMITDATAENVPATADYIASAGVDLLGEILGGDRPKFQRGVTNYPTIGDPVELITNRELRTVYETSGADHDQHRPLQQDPSIGAYIDVDEMLSKHFAVLGTTGVGKSSGVALILSEILEARPNLRIFLLDVAQRIRPLLRRARARPQSAQPEAAVLAVQFRGDRRRLLRAAAPASRRRSRSSPRSSRSPRASTPSTQHARPYRRSKRSRSQAAPATPSTRRCPTASPT